MVNQAIHTLGSGDLYLGATSVPRRNTLSPALRKVHVADQLLRLDEKARRQIVGEVIEGLRRLRRLQGARRLFVVSRDPPHQLLFVINSSSTCC